MSFSLYCWAEVKMSASRIWWSASIESGTKRDCDAGSTVSIWGWDAALAKRNCLWDEVQLSRWGFWLGSSLNNDGDCISLGWLGAAIAVLWEAALVLGTTVSFWDCTLSWTQSPGAASGVNTGVLSSSCVPVMREGLPIAIPVDQGQLVSHNHTCIQLLSSLNAAC